jgi:surface antigen
VFTPPSATAGVRDDFLTPSSVFAVAGNLLKQASGSLNREDRITHTKTLIWAASNLENGQMAEWSNPNNGTAGRTKIILTKPVQGGYCRMLSTLVEKEGIVKEYTEFACKTIDSQFWTFSTR